MDSHLFLYCETTPRVSSWAKDECPKSKPVGRPPCGRISQSADKAPLFIRLNSSFLRDPNGVAVCPSGFDFGFRKAPTSAQDDSAEAIFYRKWCTVIIHNPMVTSPINQNMNSTKYPNDEVVVWPRLPPEAGDSIGSRGTRQIRIWNTQICEEPK